MVSARGPAPRSHGRAHSRPSIAVRHGHLSYGGLPHVDAAARLSVEAIPPDVHTRPAGNEYVSRRSTARTTPCNIKCIGYGPCVRLSRLLKVLMAVAVAVPLGGCVTAASASESTSTLPAAAPALQAAPAQPFA